jgi:hypothetical protein
VRERAVGERQRRTLVLPVAGADQAGRPLAHRSAAGRRLESHPPRRKFRCPPLVQQPRRDPRPLVGGRRARLAPCPWRARPIRRRGSLCVRSGSCPLSPPGKQRYPERSRSGGCHPYHRFHRHRLATRTSANRLSAAACGLRRPRKRNGHLAVPVPDRRKAAC